MYTLTPKIDNSELVDDTSALAKISVEKRHARASTAAGIEYLRHLVICAQALTDDTTVVKLD